jgi:hypothetical protein
VRFAYADPPYLGCCSYYGHEHGDDGRCWDDVSTHYHLLRRLIDDYPDGWAMSMSSPSLRHLLPLTPPVARVAAWVKPFASFKPTQRVAYAWEPVVFCGGRGRGEATPGRDYIAEGITLRRGFTGAKPHRFNRWVLDLLGFIDNEDTIDDLYPGTGGMSDALAAPPLEGIV